MSDFLYAIVLGIIQGLTEFWPVSSSAHLVIAHDLLKFDFVDDLTFDVALHLGTLLALLIYFWPEVVKYVGAFVRSLRKWDLKNDFDQRMAWYIIVASIPAGIGGFLLEKWADTVLRSLWLVSGLLFLVGILFILVEKYSSKKKPLESLDWKTIILIGLSQVLALFPGVSRSGVTTLTGLSQGLNRVAAARFSFLLSMPVIFGAGMKKMFDAYKGGLDSHQWLVMFTGAVSAALVGYFAIRVLMKFFERHSLNMFAYYRIALALSVVAYLMLR
jgi:undecaprenyl-diphosphatase